MLKRNRKNIICIYNKYIKGKKILKKYIGPLSQKNIAEIEKLISK